MPGCTDIHVHLPGHAQLSTSRRPGLTAMRALPLTTIDDRLSWTDFRPENVYIRTGTASRGAHVRLWPLAHRSFESRLHDSIGSTNYTCSEGQGPKIYMCQLATARRSVPTLFCSVSYSSSLTYALYTLAVKMNQFTLQVDMRRATES